MLKWDLLVSLDKELDHEYASSHFVGSVLFNGVSIMYMSNGEGILTGRDGAVEKSLCVIGLLRPVAELSSHSYSTGSFRLGA